MKKARRTTVPKGEGKSKETESSPSGMKKVGVLVRFYAHASTDPMHFQLGTKWRWLFAGVPKPLLQIVLGETIIAEIDAQAVLAVCGPAWTSPMQRTPERP